jgi:hypothetical protein
MVHVSKGVSIVEFAWCLEHCGDKCEDWNGWWEPSKTESPDDLPIMLYVFSFNKPEDEIAFKLRFGY